MGMGEWLRLLPLTAFGRRSPPLEGPTDAVGRAVGKGGGFQRAPSAFPLPPWRKTNESYKREAPSRRATLVSLSVAGKKPRRKSIASAGAEHIWYATSDSNIRVFITLSVVRPHRSSEPSVYFFQATMRKSLLAPPYCAAAAALVLLAVALPSADGNRRGGGGLFNTTSPVKEEKREGKCKHACQMYLAHNSLTKTRPFSFSFVPGFPAGEV